MNSNCEIPNGRPSSTPPPLPCCPTAPTGTAQPPPLPAGLTASRQANMHEQSVQSSNGRVALPKHANGRGLQAAFQIKPLWSASKQQVSRVGSFLQAFWRNGFYIIPDGTRAFLARPNQPMPIPSTNGQNMLLLRRFAIWGNWKVDKRLFPHYLVKDAGDQLEAINSVFVETLQREREHVPELTAGLVWDAENQPNETRPLRVVNQIAPGHTTATDVVFMRQGRDLHVQFEGRAWTKISVLRQLAFAAAFVTCFVALLGFLLLITNLYSNWALDYAKKHANDPQLVQLLCEEITRGRKQTYDEKYLENLNNHVEQIVEQAERKNENPIVNLMHPEKLLGTLLGSHNFKPSDLKYFPKWSPLKLFIKDPIVFVTSVGIYPGLFALLVWTGLHFIPRTFLRVPCKWLGWPNPQFFAHKVKAHSGSVHGLLSDVLMRDFNIDRARIINLNTPGL